MISQETADQLNDQYLIEPRGTSNIARNDIIYRAIFVSIKIAHI